MRKDINKETDYFVGEGGRGEEFVASLGILREGRPFYGCDQSLATKNCRSVKKIGGRASLRSPHRSTKKQGNREPDVKRILPPGQEAKEVRTQLANPPRRK